MKCELLHCCDHIFILCCLLKARTFHKTSFTCNLHPRVNVYLINRVHSRQLPQSCHAKHLHDQVRPEQMRQHLEDLELGMAHPHFSQQPGQGLVCGQENRRVHRWRLPQLLLRSVKRFSSFFNSMFWEFIVNW